MYPNCHRWRRVLFGAACLWLLHFPVFAQSPSASVAIRVSPQYLVLNGLRLEVERSLPGNPRHTLVLATEVYGGEFSPARAWVTRNNPTGRVAGLGLAGQYRVYLSEEEALLRGVYAGYGLFGQSFRLSFEDRDWVMTVGEDELTYYVQGMAPQTQKTLAVGGTVALGIQRSLGHARLLVDLFTGITAKKSWTGESAYRVRFQDTGFDYATSSVYLTGGLSVGWQLR